MTIWLRVGGNYTYDSGFQLVRTYTTHYILKRMDYIYELMVLYFSFVCLSNSNLKMCMHSCFTITN